MKISINYPQTICIHPVKWRLKIPSHLGWVRRQRTPPPRTPTNVWRTDRHPLKRCYLHQKCIQTVFFFQLWWQIIRVTDGRTDWRNDKVSYRVAITRLKILFSLIQILQLSIVEWTRTFEGFLIQVMPSFAEIGFFYGVEYCTIYITVWIWL